MSNVRIEGPELSNNSLIEWVSVLDGFSVRFRLQYIERCDRWDIRIATSEGDIIVAGQRITVGFDLLHAYSDSRLPPGTITVIDSESKYDAPVTRDGWRERFWMLYQTTPQPTDDRELTTSQVILPA